MRNILALVGAATLAFLVVGWYLGWYQISSLPSPGGRQSVAVELHPDKVVKDVRQGVERGGDLVDSALNKGEPKPTTLPTPQGPASRFFTPSEPKPSSNGWKPIQPQNDEGFFGFRKN